MDDRAADKADNVDGDSARPKKKPKTDKKDLKEQEWKSERQTMFLDEDCALYIHTCCAFVLRKRLSCTRRAGPKYYPGPTSR